MLSAPPSRPPILCSLLLAALPLSCPSKSTPPPPPADDPPSSPASSSSSASSAAPPPPPKKTPSAHCRTRCTQGSLESCVTLGLMLASGKGAPKDATRAVTLFAKACDGQLAVGCGTL